MPTRGCGEEQKSHAAEGWQGADAISMTPRCGVRCRPLQPADAGFLCVVFDVVDAPGSRRALGSGASHADHTAPPTHTLHITRRRRGLTVFVWLP